MKERVENSLPEYEFSFLYLIILFTLYNMHLSNTSFFTVLIFMHLNPRLLTIFQAAMRSGSASAAALQINITQPAISRALKELEETVGFSLFQRSRYGLTPTPEARLLAVEVERAHAVFDRVGETARMIRDKEQGQLRIAALPAYADGFASRMVADFIDGSPGIAVHLVAANRNEVNAMIKSHQVDIGVTASEDEGLDWGIYGLRVNASIDRSAVCIFASGDQLEDCDTISAADLQDKRMIQLTEGSSLRTLAERRGLSRSAQSYAPIEVGAQTTIVSLVASGVGVGIVDPEVISDSVTGQVSMRKLASPITWSTVLVTRESPAIPRVAENFLAWAEDHIHKYLTTF